MREIEINTMNENSQKNYSGSQDLKFDFIIEILFLDSSTTLFEFLLANYVHKIGFVYCSNCDFETSPIICYRILLIIK